MRQKQSRLGVASFILSFIPIPGTIMILLVAPFSASGPAAGDWMLVLWLVFLSSPVVGLGLGIAGLCQRTRIRTFAAVGISLNILYLLGVVVLVVRFWDDAISF